MPTSPGLSSRSASVAAKLSPTQLYSGRPERFSNGIVTMVSVAIAADAVKQRSKVKIKAGTIRLIIRKIKRAARSDAATLNGPTNILVKNATRIGEFQK